MDPVTLGAVVAALVAKAVATIGEKSGEAGVAALGKLLGRVRSRLRNQGDDAERAALARVEDPPAGPRQLEALAAAINRHAADDPAFRTELTRLVDEARAGGMDVQSITQTALGNQNIQLGSVTDSSVNITLGPSAR